MKARKTPKAVSAYMAELGRRGGKAKGDEKRRTPEHYAEMARRSAETRRKKAADKARDAT